MTRHNSSESIPQETDAARAASWLSRAVGGKFGFLLCALIALLLSVPMIVHGWVWNMILGLFASGVLVASLHAARPGRQSLAIGVILALTDLGIGRLVFFEGGRWLIAVQATLWLATLIYVIVTILGAVFERDNVDIETLQAALCVYLILGMIWIYVYALIGLAAPGSFQFQGQPRVAWSDDQTRRTEFMRLFIFSYSKLTGSGNNDLKPVSGFANICVCMEALSAQVYLALVIARLVAKQIGKQPPKK